MTIPKVMRPFVGPSEPPSRNKHKIAVQLFEQAGFRVYRSERMPLNELAVRRASTDLWLCVTLENLAIDTIERAIAELKEGYTEHQRRAQLEALPAGTVILNTDDSYP